MDQQEDKTIELKYSLTFLQRYFNPPAVLIYHFLQMLGLPTLYLLLVDFWGDGIPVLFTWVIIFFVYRRFLGDAMFLLKRDASRCIVVVIRPDAIGFGRGKTEYWVFRTLYKVHRGLFGVNLIRHCWGYYTIVVPESAISFSELRRLVEENAKDAKHRSPPRLWVVGGTCLFAFSVCMATLIILRMYGAGETASPEDWGVAVGSAALIFGWIFFCFYLASRRWKRKAREQEMKDNSNKEK